MNQENPNADDGLPPLPDDKKFSGRPSRARYDKVKAVVDLKWRRRAPQPERMMRDLVDALWDAFGGNPWTWCGFWLPQPDGKAFHAGAARPDHAPSPAPMDGPAGRALAAGEPQRDAASVAAPVLDKNGRAWAVFEVRSSSAFDDMDVRWIEQLLRPFQSIERPAPPPLP
jgi:hypothetical protein